MSATFKPANSSNVVINSNQNYTIPNEGCSRKYLNFSRASSERLIYINYPETITPTTNCFANSGNSQGGNKHLIQTTISAGETVQLFFSHHNQSSRAINYAILIWNPNSSSTTATVTATNSGYAYGWNISEFTPWVSFYNGNTLTARVPGQSSRFLLDWRNIATSSGPAVAAPPFSGIMRITSNYSVTLTVCMWHGSDTSVIDGTETQYPYNISEPGNPYDNAPAAKFTGIGAGYYLTTSNTVTATNASGNGIYYSLASCDSGNTNEIIPITLSGASNTEASEDENFPLNNLGNWGAQYQFNTTLDNSSGSTAKTFKCYIGRNGSEGKFVIKYGSNVGYCSIGATTSTLGTAYKWNFLEVYVPAYSRETVSFQLSHATCSSSPIYLQWKL
mgnify:CR=1 FL=1|jgi:hypothetical protein